MGERGHAAAGGVDLRQVDVDQRDPGRVATIGEDLSPRRNGQRVAVGASGLAARGGVGAALRGGEHVTAGFNRAGAQQAFPMRGARDRREGGRDGENLRAGLGEGAVELRETHVVADRQADLAKWRVGYRPGDRAVLADTPLGKIGLTICYDMRFPKLYRDLAQAGAQILTLPAAFSPVTGAAHWESLLRARAIETGCYVLAPAQCGTHAATRGKTRSTHGHSLAVAPWGEVLADGGDTPGVTLVEIDLKEVDKARRRVPSLTHDRPFEGP